MTAQITGAPVREIGAKRRASNVGDRRAAL
jgi:hypothetical protein